MCLQWWHRHWLVLHKCLLRSTHTTHTYTYTHTLHKHYTHTHTCTCAHSNTHTHRCTHTHTHTHLFKFSCDLSSSVTCSTSSFRRLCHCGRCPWWLFTFSSHARIVGQGSMNHTAIPLFFFLFFFFLKRYQPARTPLFRPRSSPQWLSELMRL